MSLPPSALGKGDLRRALLERRLRIDDAERARMDAAIAAHLAHLLTTQPVASLGLFWPIRKEPDLLDLYRRLAVQGMRLSLPLVTEKKAPLRYVRWAPDDPMVKDSFGIPVPEKKFFVEMPDAVLVPCVGFNSQRFRIGYGGGFYDRTLALTPKPLAIGIAYSCQLAEFDIGPHDIPLDLIVTEISY